MAKDPKEPTQREKFEALAREAECAMDGDAFDNLIEDAHGIKPPTKEEAFEAKRQGKAD